MGAANVEVTVTYNGGANHGRAMGEKHRTKLEILPLHVRLGPGGVESPPAFSHKADSPVQ